MDVGTRLLREADGVEGLRMVEEVLGLGDPALLKGVDGAEADAQTEPWESGAGHC